MKINPVETALALAVLPYAMKARATLIESRNVKNANSQHTK